MGALCSSAGFVPLDTCAGLRIESLTVQADRIRCEVRVAQKWRYTSPDLVKRICASHPTLPQHACVNERGDLFGSVIDRTSTPHLFEHLVIDRQLCSCSDVDAVYVGTTQWIDESTGFAQVEVSFTDDLVALRAFRDAAHILNEALVR